MDLEEFVCSFLSETLNRNERQPPCRKCPGPCCNQWPHYTQEGPPQVQAKADPYIQEQGPQARPEGVRRKHLALVCSGTKVEHNQVWLLCCGAALVTTSPAWRVSAQTSQWCAHGKPLATWSSATWPNTASSKAAASCLPWLVPALRLILSCLLCTPARHAGIRLLASPLMPSRLSTSAALH